MAGRTVFVVLIALAIGLLILANGFGRDGDGGGATGTTTTTAGTTTVQETTTTTISMQGVSVIVANASGVQGSAGRMTTGLQGCNFTMLPATNAVTSGQAVTQVHNVANVATEEQATFVAEAVGVAYSGPLPDPSPVRNIGEAGVVVVLGTDKANAQPDCPGTLPTAPTTDTTATADTTTTTTG
jgi:hypothetical protein